MATVVRPIGIQYLELGLCWHPPDRLEVFLDKDQVIHFHGQALLCLIGRKVFCRIGRKEVQVWNGLIGFRKILLGNAQTNILEARIHWVEKIVLNGRQLGFIDVLVDQVKLSRMNHHIIGTT